MLVSLLDIHVEPPRPGENQPPPLEILEVGTGNGALTLHLARAIHGANVLATTERAGFPISIREQESPSPPLDPALESSESTPSSDPGATLANSNGNETGAIVHTLDISQHHSDHARSIVEGFRQGMYKNDISFHVGDLPSWIDKQLESRSLKDAEDKTFLTHIVMDIPNAQDYLEKAANILQTNGGLIVFCPSISQIMAAVYKVDHDFLHLKLERVLELGPYLTGGKEWDVATVNNKKQRWLSHRKQQSVGGGGGGREADASSEGGTQDNREDSSSPDTEVTSSDEAAGESVDIGADASADEDRWKMVCRPKVGYTVAGGGFLAFWRKMKY